MTKTIQNEVLGLQNLAEFLVQVEGGLSFAGRVPLSRILGSGSCYGLVDWSAPPPIDARHWAGGGGGFITGGLRLGGITKCFLLKTACAFLYDNPALQIRVRGTNKTFL